VPGRAEPNGGGLGVGQAVRLVGGGAAAPGAAAASASARSTAAMDDRLRRFLAISR